MRTDKTPKMTIPLKAINLIIFSIVVAASAFPQSQATPILDGADGGFMRAAMQTVADLVGQSLGQNGYTFDYLIAGGGTAGLVLANRLSANPRISVAVIEAGSYYELTNPLLSSTPAADVMWVGSATNDLNPLVDWGFVTEPQVGCHNRKMHYPRGLCLGGSSARNFMIYQRGTKQSYQKWADEIDDQSYSFDNFLPYFKKSVHFSPPTRARASNATARYNIAAHVPRGGPLHISYPNYAQPFSYYVDGAFHEIGIPPADDFNSGTLNGGQYCTSTINPANRHRDSSQTAFLNSAQDRPNLRVFQATRVKSIIFDGNRATGLWVAGLSYLPFKLTARKEVILSAGAFQSPQLLMVSGVGPRAVLDKFNITPVSVLEGVGQGMQDHVFMGPTYRVKVDTLTRLANDPIYLLKLAADYALQKAGPMTNPSADYIAWEKVPKDLRAGFTPEAQKDLSKFPEDWPELEYISAPGYVGSYTSLFFSQPRDGHQYATILATIVAPLSRGSVTIKSTDTDDLPLINPNFLAHPTDQQVAVAGYKRARQAFKTQFMSDVLADTKEYFPGEHVQTDEQILEAIKGSVFTVYHASCTCKMGRKSDKTAVVDSKARVFGTRNLRVVDASSFALLPPGHPQSTVYALAEKIADDILTGN